LDADDADYRDLKFRGEKKLSALICKDLFPIIYIEEHENKCI
jgi:hypothetical protein